MSFMNKVNNRDEVAKTQRLFSYSPKYLEGEIPKFVRTGFPEKYEGEVLLESRPLCSHL